VEILIVRRTLLSVVATLLLAPPPVCRASDGLEYQVKAAFLFNFLKFVEWPVAASDVPWVIGILGHDPFAGALEDTVRGKIVNGRRVEVRHFPRAADVKDCNIIFIGRADSQRLGMPSQPGLLTVGEAPEFLKSGGIINFYLDDNRVHFEIRPEVAHAAGLRVSSQLLKLGRAL
jgi:hypothetical protein